MSEEQEGAYEELAEVQSDRGKDETSHFVNDNDADKPQQSEQVIEDEYQGAQNTEPETVASDQGDVDCVNGDEQMSEVPVNKEEGVPISEGSLINSEDGSPNIVDSDQSAISEGSSPLKKVSLDDSDDSDTDSEGDIRRTMGLTYTDHNYDVADPSKRYRKPDEGDYFPEIAGLSLDNRYDDLSEVGGRGSYGDPGMHRQPRQVFRSSDGSFGSPIASRSRNDSLSYPSNPPKGFVTVRSDILPAYMNSYGTGGSPRRMNSSAVISSNPPSNVGQMKRIPQVRQPSVGTPVRSVGRFATMNSSPGLQQQYSQVNEGASSSMPTLLAAPKVDQPPHRFLESTSQRVAAPDTVPHRDRIPQTQQHGRPSYSAADPSQAALANAPAPLIVSSRGSKPLMRGRGGSQSNRGKKDDIGAQSDDGGSQAPLHSQHGSRSISSSPRKQVHFSDSLDGNGHDDGMMEDSGGETSPLRSQGHSHSVPAPPHRAMVPQQHRSPPKMPMLPPHRVLQVNTPAVNTPSRVPVVPSTRSYVPVDSVNAVPGQAAVQSQPQPHMYSRQPPVDPHSMPENIIDDGPSQEPEPSPRKSLKDTSLPPEVAALALALAPGLPQQPAASVHEFNEEGIKAKIAEIRQELEQERILMEEKGQQSQSMSSSMTDDSAPRGRGRPKGTGRSRNSLSNSSSTFGSPGHAPLLSPGSPPKGSPAHFLQHPGSSPSRMAPRFMGMGNRPPGSSPVRTNLDFNNHLAGGQNANHTPRAVYPIPAPSSGKVTTNLLSSADARKDKKLMKAAVTSKSKLSDDDFESDDPEDFDDLSDSDEEEHGDWSTVCLCGFESNSAWMTCCDKCDAWIHNECYGLPFKDMKNIAFHCYNCNPNQKLPLSKKEARALQINNKRARHLHKRRVKEAKSKAQARRSGSGVKATIKLPLKATPIPGKNTYSKRARAMVNLYESEQSPRRPIYTAPARPNFKRMFVAKGTEGLVADNPMPPGTVVMEFTGHVCCPDECGRDLDGNYHQLCILYDGLAPADVPPSRQRDAHLCIDARKTSGDSRYIRRSCRPNSVLRHSITNGLLSVWVVTKEHVAGKTEITIPFDCDYRAVMNKIDCECAQTNDKDSEECLILSDPLAIQLGHREHPYVPKNTSHTFEDAKTEKRGRRSKPTKKAPELELHAEPEEEKLKLPREEKSEEESIAGRLTAHDMDESLKQETEDIPTEPSKKRGRPSNVKKGSEKEEPSKEEPSSAVRSSRRRNENSSSSIQTPRSPKKEPKDDVNYLLPGDRNKPSREDRKLLAQVAQFEASSAKKKNEPKAERRKGRSSTGTPKITKTETPEKQPKKEIKDEPSSPIKEVRESARKKKKDADSAHAPTSSTSHSVQPPRKRWAAASQEQLQEAATPRPATPPSSTPPYSGKKQWLRRHAAESVGAEQSKPTLSSAVTPPPFKKRRHMREAGESDDLKRDEAANVLAGMGSGQREGAISPELQEQLRASALTVKAYYGNQNYELPALSPTGIVLPVSKLGLKSPVVSPVVNETSVPQEEDAPPPKKVVKRLSIEDYKKRRGAAAAATADIPEVKVEEQRTSPRKAGFIPELGKVEDVDLGLSNFAPPINPFEASKSTPLNSPRAQPTIEDLRKTILGNDDRVPASSTIAPPPPPPRIRSPRGGDVSTDDEGSVPKMSLAERLATEFGIGTVSPQRAVVPGISGPLPPVGQLPICPPPVTRRDLTDTSSTSTPSSHPHRSRWS